MKIGLFRKKPVVIEAVQFTGHNDHEVWRFVGEYGYDPDDDRPTWVIRTLEGLMTAEVGDWIIKGVKGEFYPCKPDIFEATYEQFGVVYIDTSWIKVTNEEAEVAEGKLGETLERLFPEGSQVDG